MIEIPYILIAGIMLLFAIAAVFETFLGTTSEELESPQTKAALKKFQDEAVRRNFAFYHPETKDFTWKESIFR